MTVVCRPYSALMHLGRAIWGNHDPKRCWMAVYGAYYDASGSQSQSSGALVVVALIATEEKWLRFERKWNEVLQEANMPYFHMKEYAHSIGPFESWKKQEEKRATFLADLIDVLTCEVDQAFSAGVWLSDFKEVNQRFQLAEKYGADHPRAGAYSFAGQLCNALVTTWMNEKHPHEKFTHVFESGDRGQGALVAYLVDFGFPYRIAWTPDERTALISDPMRGEIRVVDKATRNERTIEIPADHLSDAPEFAGSASPEGIAISTDGSHAYITLQGRNQVAEIDLSTLEIIGYMATGVWPDGIGYSPITH